MNDALHGLWPEFERLYAREERSLMEQMEFNSLYKWFVGLNPDDRVPELMEAPA